MYGRWYVIGASLKLFMKASYPFKFGKSTSDYLDINIGAPQGTKLGLVLWLIYINDLQVPDYKTVKYADNQGRLWRSQLSPLEVGEDNSNSIVYTNNYMILNADKTVIFNFFLNLFRPLLAPIGGAYL